MALPTSNLVEQMSQLDAARNLVLGDSAFYPQIVQGILPIIGSAARLELRRWGADFLAETFASPALAVQPKQKMSASVLPILMELLESPDQDIAVVRSVIQTAASVYALVFRAIIDQPGESALWEKMTTIKQNILKRWDTSPHSVKVCCVKFVQKVVQVQTPGVISDPRRPEQNETSLSLVPRNHPLIPMPNLEAEASGLLDRLLNVFHDNSSDPILVNATLNCLPILIRTRQSISNKIITAILDFNPLASAKAPITPAVRVNVTSMERTTRALLINVTKRIPNHPLAGRIQQYVEKLAQSRNEVLEEAPRKRALPTEPTDVVDSAKRARLGVETPPQLKIPPLPPGPTSFAQLFSLTDDVGLTSFDVKQLPFDLLVKITVPVLSRVDPEALDQAVGAVRSRYLTICKKQAFEHQQHPTLTKPTEEEDEDDYEPEYEPMDVPAVEQPAAIAEQAPDEAPDFVALGPFVLPQPPPLSEDEAAAIGKDTVARVFNMIATLDQPSALSKDLSHKGFGRLAASSFDRDSWLTLLTRLATRASAGLELDEEDEIKKVENGHIGGQMLSSRRRVTMAEGIREMLYRYVLEDFRVRINVAISWMNEEWYNDRIQHKHAVVENGGDTDDIVMPRHYEEWVMRLLEGIMPYLDARDKVLIRFLSEIPELNEPLVQKVKTLADDPERVNLCIQALHYLVLMRPPAREICLDALQDLYEKVEEVRPLAAKVLAKWRPDVLPKPQEPAPTTAPEPQQQTSPENNDTNANATTNAPASAETNGFKGTTASGSMNIPPDTNSSARPPTQQHIVAAENH